MVAREPQKPPSGVAAARHGSQWSYDLTWLTPGWGREWWGIFEPDRQKPGTSCP
ncbi:hypothetical protein PoMZ_10134 [Pyricularia oryzae]|uniref:Uncharacterized protein n=1 Tax=Pyricularia oryzae TaxID=318829 RepID=A0A4P7N3B6_PYROR|nr:hypothetical protein PoMZ_10134 [Pyricularia oryzae]